MNVIFSNRAYTGILSETTEKIKTETGGLFLGVYEDDTWYVIEAIDPGPESIFEVAYFEYDQEYTQHLINKIANLYSARLELIGLWHRHPGSLDIFSSTDDGTNAEYASRNKHGSISALVNIDPDFRLTIYHVSSPCKYKKIEYSVGDDLIPEEFLKFKTPEQYANLMHKRTHGKTSHSDVTYKRSISLVSFLKRIIPGLVEYETDENFVATDDDGSVIDNLLDQLLEDITFLSDEVGVVMTVLARQNRIVFEQETIDGTTRIYFGYDGENDRTIFEYNGTYYEYSSGLLKKLFEDVTKTVATAEEIDVNDAFSVKSAFRNIFCNWKNGKS